jgi:hypothetical protein
MPERSVTRIMPALGLHTAARPTRSTTFEIACSSGMFTHLQMKPRVVLSLCFTGWSAWLREHAVSHAALIREHATGFVPIGFDIEYLQPVTFFDCESVVVTTEVTTWNPPRFHTLQDVMVKLTDPDGQMLARVSIQEIAVRVDSQETLAAQPARLPASIADVLLDDAAHTNEPVRLLNRPQRYVPLDTQSMDEYRYDFTVHRHACEAADQWYSEHVTDYMGASRESMVFAHSKQIPQLLPGLARRIERIRIGLRRPYQFFDQGQILTRAYRVDDELRFVHCLYSSNGVDAGDAVEVFATT